MSFQSHFMMIPVLVIFLCTLSLSTDAYPAETAQRQDTASDASIHPPAWLAPAAAQLEKELTAKYGEGQRGRLQRGLRQVSSLWRSEDGPPLEFETLVRRHFAGTPETQDILFQRMENLLEQLDGHMNEISLNFKRQADLDIGPLLPVDEIFAGYSPSAHVLEDFFKNRLAFIILLNFPLTTLEQRLQEGEQWSRRQWAEARLAPRFSKRIPAEAQLTMAEAVAKAESYIASYNIWMHHVLDEKGSRLFPAGMCLLSHWNLRDEIKSCYSEAGNGFAKQRLIEKIMDRIVTQTIPAAVIDNPLADWNPATNEVKLTAIKDSDRTIPSGTTAINGKAEPDTRYAVWLAAFQAGRKIDPYSPMAPSLIARRFNEDREIPEARVKAILEELLQSPLLAQTAQLIRKRLGRPLEAFDIWYNGLLPRGSYSPADLDRRVAERYPTPAAFEKDIPTILTKLGFSAESARSIAANIIVDPARGSGHAAGSSMRSARVHLRTRVGKNGMDYKGYNIAVHELGHNVEQTLTLNRIDHTLLQGVPNTAFTEAFAFVFQSRDLQLLGLNTVDPQAEALRTVNEYWTTCEIAAVSLVDIAVWHWMYEHPEATAAQLKEATLKIAKDLWNRFYAPVIGKKDSPLLAIYSHLVQSLLYLPDYALGHLIAFQIEAQIRQAGTVGPEMERMTQSGNIAPDLWMKKAVGAAVGGQAMLKAAETSLKILETAAH